MWKALCTASILIACSCNALCQKKNDSYRLHIKSTTAPVIVDANTQDKGWTDAEVAGDFYMITPMDTSFSRVKTEVRMCYDENDLYILAECFHHSPGPYFVESLRRDFVFGKNDNFLLFMDPFDDLTNGFSFGVNAAGAQWDGSMYEGGKVDLNWDNKWTSAVKHYGDKWVFEAAIPFRSIRYKKGIKRWGINFSRMDLKTSEKSSWAPVPRQFPSAALAYTGTIVWDTPPPISKKNISVIPYVLGGINRNYETGSPTEFRKDIGIDGKIALSSSVNLDLTVNPDFSQVEVDRQVTNLDRFELFFPERRQFFLENGDLFANIGYATLRPFFSRRIGLGTPIHYGFRLSGKLNKNWRMGLMNVQSARQDADNLPIQNYTVASFQRRVFARSNVGMFVINKQSFGRVSGDDTTKRTYNAFNRNIGIEYNLASSNNLWTGKLIAIKSFAPGKQSDDYVHAGHLQYAIKKWTVAMQYEKVGKDYIAEAGYVPRKGYLKLWPQIALNFFPARGKVLAHGPKLTSAYYFSPGLTHTDHENLFSYTVTFRKQSVVAARASNDFVQLLTPFDPTNIGNDSLAAGTRHHWNSVGIDFISKPQSIVTYLLSSTYGGYYAGGKRFNVTTEFGYRFQPYLNISLSGNYNQLQLPMPWGRINFLLIGPRVDLTMTNNLFLTAFMQYNEQSENINLNLRFQWRFKPASDLFVVYTDNYFPENLTVRNRALVLKFNYWWNM